MTREREAPSYGSIIMAAWSNIKKPAESALRVLCQVMMATVGLGCLGSLSRDPDCASLKTSLLSSIFIKADELILLFSSRALT